MGPYLSAWSPVCNTSLKVTRSLGGAGRPGSRGFADYVLPRSWTPSLLPGPQPCEKLWSTLPIAPCFPYHLEVSTNMNYHKSCLPRVLVSVKHFATLTRKVVKTMGKGLGLQCRMIPSVWSENTVTRSYSLMHRASGSCKGRWFCTATYTLVCEGLRRSKTGNMVVWGKVRSPKSTMIQKH